jgi:hypothetical protein
MATGTATQYDIGTRRNFTTLGDRNFEVALAIANPATVAYSSLKNGLWWVDGSTYNIGQTLPYDANAAASYSTKAKSLLVFYWEQEWIKPTT